MARIFSAVDIEHQDLKKELSRVRDQLDLGFKPMPADKMHVTLEFFEDVDEKRIESIKKAMRSVDTGSFQAEVSGVGAFPSQDYIRVVWAGVVKGRFQKLYSQISDHGVESDNNHDFKPHITLMRMENISAEKKRKLQKSLEEFGNYYFGALEVESVKLFESRLTGNGSRYSVLEEVDL